MTESHQSLPHSIVKKDETANILDLSGLHNILNLEELVLPENMLYSLLKIYESAAKSCTKSTVLTISHHMICISSLHHLMF